MKEKELNIDEVLELAQIKFYKDLKLCTSYREAANKCAVMAIQYMAYGFVFLTLGDNWKTAYCFKQAGFIGACTGTLSTYSKQINEQKSVPVGTLAIN